MIPDSSQPPAHRVHPQGQAESAYPPPAPYPCMYEYPSTFPHSTVDGSNPPIGSNSDASPQAVIGLVNTSHLPHGMSLQDAMEISEFDRLVRHQDFDKILSAAAKLKSLQNGSSSLSQPGIMNLALSNLHRSKATKVIRENVCNDGSPDIMPRGLFPHTDTLVAEAIDSLTLEFDRCLKVKSSSCTEDNNCTPSPSPKKARQKKNKKGRDSPSQSIAVKYSKRQTDILTEWMIANKSHPFPDQIQIQALSEAAGLSYSQVVNWTTNVRKRNLKATVEHGKKPHHFLDFLFLADDREKRMLEEGGELPKVAAASYLSNKKGGKSSMKRQTTKSKTKSQAQSRPRSASKPRGAAAAAAGTAKQQSSESMTLPAFQPPFAHSSRPMHPYQLPPPLVKGVSPYPPIAADGRPPCPPLSYPPNAHSVRAPYPGYMPNWHGHPQPPTASISQPLPMDAHARNCAPSLQGGVTSPPHHQTESRYQNNSRATVTPLSSASPTASRRNTGDSLDEALSFWNSGMFSAEDISNDTVLGGNGFGAHAAGGAEDEEKAALLRVTEGGIISTPPREDEDDELWLGTGEDDVLDSFDSDAEGPTKRSSIIDAAMLPQARNEKARRMSQRNPSGHGATRRSSASVAGAEHLQQHPKRMSLTVDEVAQALAMPLPLDDDDGLMREFLDENITAVGV